MEIPGLGKVSKDHKINMFISDPVAVPLLGGRECKFILENYEKDSNPEEFHVAIANFLSASPEILRLAEPELVLYFKDYSEFWEVDGYAPIASAGDLWRHVHLGNQPIVTRRAHGDHGIYISLECNCDWEVEHGLEFVFKNGLKVTKLGPYDGHLTNSDAFGKESLENVVYRQLS